MADPFIAEIRMFPFNFAPRGWAFCDGQLISISQNTALFALLGTTYGGNGTTTFGLPDLRGRAPMHFGQGPGLSARILGEMQGTETVTLSASQLPVHQHPVTGQDAVGNSNDPTGRFPAKPFGGGAVYGSGPPVAMAPEATPPAGAGQPHNNMQPYLTIHFCIALQGIFPPRS